MIDLERELEEHNKLKVGTPLEASYKYILHKKNLYRIYSEFPVQDLRYDPNLLKANGDPAWELVCQNVNGVVGRFKVLEKEISYTSGGESVVLADGEVVEYDYEAMCDKGYWVGPQMSGDQGHYKPMKDFKLIGLMVWR